MRSLWRVALVVVALALPARAQLPKEPEERLEALERALERELEVHESEHFLLVYELDKVKAKKKRKPEEVPAYLLGVLEAQFAEHVERFGVDPKKAFQRRALVLVWKDRPSHEVAGETTCDVRSDQPVYRHGTETIASIWYDGKRTRSFEELERLIFHYTAHGLLSHMKPARWLGEAHGWISAGYAHWWARERFGASEYFLSGIVHEDVNAKPEKWPAALRKLVEKGKAPELQDVLSRGGHDMSMAHHIYATGLVDFLLSKGPAKFKQLLSQVKRRTPSRDAIQVVYGLKFDELEEAFEAWVVATYPKR